MQKSVKDMAKSKVSTIVPCYNEQENVDTVYTELTAVLSDTDCDYEIIYVDNGAIDNQLELMKDVYNKDPEHVRVVSLSRNFGYQMSMSAGLEFATGDAIVLIDADLQDPPQMIQDFIAKWQEGYDVVYGVRKKRKAPLLLRMFYRLFYKIFNKTSDIKVPLNASEFGLMSKEVVDQIKKMPESIRFIRGMRAWVGFNQIGISYIRKERKRGKTKFRFFDCVALGMDGILSFSTRILTFTSIFGLLTVVTSVLVLIYILVWKFSSGETIPGYAAIMVSITFFSGIIVFMLGIAGAFIERIFLEVKSRPKFLVKETYGLTP